MERATHTCPQNTGRKPRRRRMARIPVDWRKETVALQKPGELFEIEIGSMSNEDGSPFVTVRVMEKETGRFRNYELDVADLGTLQSNLDATVKQVKRSTEQGGRETRGLLEAVEGRCYGRTYETRSGGSHTVHDVEMILRDEGSETYTLFVRGLEVGRVFWDDPERVAAALATVMVQPRPGGTWSPVYRGDYSKMGGARAATLEKLAEQVMERFQIS